MAELKYNWKEKKEAVAEAIPKPNTIDLRDKFPSAKCITLKGDLLIIEDETLSKEELKARLE